MSHNREIGIVIGIVVIVLLIGAVLMTANNRATAALPEKWEHIANSTHRMEVKGGWLVTVGYRSITFYPDPEHLWRDR